MRQGWGRTPRSPALDRWVAGEDTHRAGGTPEAISEQRRQDPSKVRSSWDQRASASRRSSAECGLARAFLCPPPCPRRPLPAALGGRSRLAWRRSGKIDKLDRVVRHRGSNCAPFFARGSPAFPGDGLGEPSERMAWKLLLFLAICLDRPPGTGYCLREGVGSAVFGLGRYVRTRSRARGC